MIANGLRYIIVEAGGKTGCGTLRRASREGHDRQVSQLAVGADPPVRLSAFGDSALRQVGDDGLVHGPHTVEELCRPGKIPLLRRDLEVLEESR